MMPLGRPAPRPLTLLERFKSLFVGLGGAASGVASVVGSVYVTRLGTTAIIQNTAVAVGLSPVGLPATAAAALVGNIAVPAAIYSLGLIAPIYNGSTKPGEKLAEQALDVGYKVLSFGAYNVRKGAAAALMNVGARLGVVHAPVVHGAEAGVAPVVAAPAAPGYAAVGFDWAFCKFADGAVATGGFIAENAGLVKEGMGIMLNNARKKLHA